MVCPVDLSGIIFVVLAVAWAVYLIPKALKHHDEVARTRSIDRFSTAMRVLARREPVNHRDARLVVAPARSADNPRVVVPTRPAPRVAPAAERASARAAARRRRRILSFLLLVTAVVAGLAGFAIVPWWSVAVPGGLTLVYLALCRTQVRRARAASWTADLKAMTEAAAPVETESIAPRRGAARIGTPYGTPLAAPVVPVRNAQGFAEVDPDEDTMSIPAVVDVVAVATDDGGSLWDPLPVTLPTYVTKPKAKRTVRTIDLNEPGTWTSGRTAEDARLVEAQAAEAAETAAAAEAEPAEETPRAVGS
jgi:hypothetical protein